jgi:predicted DNA-binding ribbon-helix-helix protein
MKSQIVKRSVVIDGRKTSVSLEDSFWKDLREIAHYQRVTVSKLLENIDKEREGNLSSAIRLFVFDQVRTHGDFWQYSRDRRLAKPPQTEQEVTSNAEAISAVS